MVFVIVEIMQCFFHLLMPCNSKASSLEKKVFEKFGVWKIFSIISSGFFFAFFSFPPFWRKRKKKETNL